MAGFTTALDFPMNARFFLGVTRRARERSDQRAVVRRVARRADLMTGRRSGLFFRMAASAFRRGRRLVRVGPVTRRAIRMTRIVRGAREFSRMTGCTNLRLGGRLEIVRLMTARARKPFRMNRTVGACDLRVARRARDGFLIDVLSVRLVTTDAIGLPSMRNLDT